MSDPLKLLEAWNSGHKSRSVEISHDDGYGACCWQIILHGHKKEVYAHEVSFFDVDRKNLPENVIYVHPLDGEPGCDDDWPGLGPTILAALKKAEELGL